MKDTLKKAREGNANAQLAVALNYIWGTNGFPVNHRQARIWYKKAALNGNPEAMFNLGTMQLNGEGGKTDTKKAVDWLKASATSKKKHIYFKEVPKLIYEIYRNGLYGIERDSRQANNWKRIYERRKRSG